MFAVICASPLAILPAKTSYWGLVCQLREARMKQGGVRQASSFDNLDLVDIANANRGINQMSKRQNLKITFLMILLCYLMAICVPDIGAVISITGATVNPFIGFIFPIIFWLKLENTHHEKLMKQELKKVDTLLANKYRQLRNSLK